MTWRRGSLRLLRSPETWNSEKRRNGFLIAECRVNRCNTGIDLPFELRRRQSLKSERVVLTVSADGVTGVVDTAHDRWVGLRHFVVKPTCPERHSYKVE